MLNSNLATRSLVSLGLFAANLSLAGTALATTIETTSSASTQLLAGSKATQSKIMPKSSQDLHALKIRCPKGAKKCKVKIKVKVKN